MPSILATIEPRAEQLNFDDFVGQDEITIKVSGVDVSPGSDQPLVLHYEGEKGRPFKPCKGMRRVLARVWGTDSESFIGRSMTLYGDPTVRFGGEDVGGIRIRAMSDLDRPMTMALTISKAKRKAYTVRPLHISLGPDRRALEAAAREAATGGIEAFRAWYKTIPGDEKVYLKPSIGVYQDIATKADADKVPDATRDAPADAASEQGREGA